MPQLFPPSANAWYRVALAAALASPFALGYLGYAIWHSPYMTRQGEFRDQPVPFSHAHHVGELGLDCRFCHATVEKAAFAGMPSTYTCMTCHSRLYTDAPMLAPVHESWRTGRPIAWNRVHDLPGFVYFDHSAHVTHGVACEECHGRVDRMPLMAQQAPLLMSWCLDCHRDPAPRLRPQAEVFRMGWRPDRDRALARGRELMRRYGITAGHMTDCYTCHR